MDLFDLFAKISIDLSDFDQGLNEASKKFKSFSDNLAKTGKGIKDVLSPAVEGFKAVESVGKKAGNAISTGMKGFAAASTAVAGFGAAAVNSGMKFDATMSEVSAISGATGKDFQDLRDKALEMGAKTKFSASEAGEAMTYMAMAGWKTEDMLGGISGIMNLAAASGEDLATTSDIVTNALTAFGMQANESGHFADIMATAASSANTDVRMMGESFKYAAPVMGTLGYTAEDTAVALGLMGNAGIQASMAGTSLKTAMLNMASPTKNMAAVMSQYGISLTDTNGKMYSLGKVMAQLREKLGGLDETTKAAAASTLFGKEAAAGMLSIINAAPKDFDDLTDAIDNCNGSAERMSAIMMDNLAGDVQYFKSALESLQIAISDSLTPTLREFAQFGQKAMASLLEGFQGSGIGGFTAALQGIVTEGITILSEKAPEFVKVSNLIIMSLVGGILDGRNEILKAANEILSSIIFGLDEFISNSEPEMIEFGLGIVNTIFEGFTQAGDVISKHIGAFVPLIAEAFLSYHEALFTVGMDILGAIGQGIIDNKDELQLIATGTIENMVFALRDNAPAIIEGGIALLEALVGAIMENMPLILETGAEIIGQLVLGISTSMPSLIAAVALILPQIAKIIDVVGSIGGAVSGVVKLVDDGITTIMGIGSKLMAGIQALFGLIMAHPVIATITAIIAAVVLLWNKCEWFRDGVKAVLEAIGGFFSVAWDLIKGVWSSAVDFFSGLVDGIKSVFDGIGEFLGGLFTAAWELVQSAWGAAKEFFSAIADGIRAAFEVVTGFLGDAFSAAWDLVSGVWDAAVGFFSAIWEGISGIFSAVAEFFGGVFSNAWDAVTSVWEGITDFFGGIWEDIKGVFSDAWDKFSEIGGNILKGIWDGISGTAGWLWDQVSGFFGGFVDGVKDFFGIHSPSTVFAEIGGFMMQGLSDGLGGESGTVDSRMLEIVKGMESTLSGMTSIFSSIGQNAMSALSGSLGNTIGALQSKVANLMNGIANAAKAALQIHSPSRVFAGIGENMALGLAEGWDDQYSSIKRQIEGGLSFGPATVGLSTTGLSGGGYGGRGMAPAPGRGDTIINIYNPEKRDAVTEAREWKKTSQLMAMAYG